MPSFEQRVDDVRTIMDAIGIRSRAVLLGCSEGASIGMVFAATSPERVSHLVLFGSSADSAAPRATPSHPQEIRSCAVVDVWAGAWGTGVTIRHFLPSYASNPDVTQQYAKLERLAFSPGALKMAVRYNIEIDVRTILSAIRVPTLVLHRQGDVISVENGKFVASHIPGAKFVAYTDCSDHLIFPVTSRVCAATSKSSLPANERRLYPISAACWRRSFSRRHRRFNSARGRDGRSGMASGA